MRGVLTFETKDALPKGQRIRLRVLDTSRVGADAIVLSEETVTIPEAFDSETDDLPFEISAPDQGEGLTIQAHLARHEGDDIREGDMITTAAIALPKDPAQRVVVPLRQV